MTYSENRIPDFSPILPIDQPPKSNSLLDLAVIEKDNEQYAKSLRFIKQVSPNRKDYKGSRELQKEVYESLHSKE